MKYTFIVSLKDGSKLVYYRAFATDEEAEAKAEKVMNDSFNKRFIEGYEVVELFK